MQKQTANTGVLLELGQVPLQIYAKKNAIKNWERIFEEDCKNEILMKSYEFALNQNLTWPNAVKSNLSEIGMLCYFLGGNEHRGPTGNANPRKNENTHVKYFQRISDIFHQNAFAEIGKETSKLRMYSQLKSEIGIEKYLLTQKNVDDRIQFTKIRLSNHPLIIEKGRHQSIEKHLRFCPFCEYHIEDEIHFLLDCRTFGHLRRELYFETHNEIGEVTTMSKIQQFVQLMTNENVTHLTARYISRALSLRQFLLENHKNCL